VISLTGPSEPNSLEPARSQENLPSIVKSVTDDIEDSTPDKQDAPEEKQGENELDLTTKSEESEVNVTSPKQLINGPSEEMAVASPSFVPNYVGQGEEMKLTSSFTPVQTTSPTFTQPAPSQPAPAPSQPDPSPSQPEPYEPEVNETFIPNVERWRNDVVAAIAAYGGPASDVDLFLTIMHRESRGLPDATNPTSGAAGLMQHMPQYWDQRAISAGYAGASPYDPIANINVSAWLLYQAAGGGWVHWSTY